MRVYEIRLQSNGGSEVVEGDVVLFLNERDFPREGLGMSVARVHPQGLPDGILRRGDVLGRRLSVSEGQVVIRRGVITAQGQRGFELKPGPG